MKKLLLVLMTCVLALGLFAQNDVRNNAQNSFSERQMHVTAAQALEVGYTFMNTGGHERGNGNVSKQTMQLVYTGTATDSLTRAVKDCYYVFSLQPKGFVIVAADERVEPILGYSYDNNFVVEGMPENVRGWLDHYGNQIKAAVDNDWRPSAEITEKWTLLRSGQAMPTRSTTSVGPLIQTTWNQGAYYNEMCPVNENGRVYTGCVATAMAQIIRYWEWPKQGINSHSYYLSDYDTLSVDFSSTTYVYDSMPNSLDYHTPSSQINEVAKLIYHCGVAVNMNYGPCSSGASSSGVPFALYNYFAYMDNGTYTSRYYYSDSAWTEMVKQELNNARPIYYRGAGVGSHAFICDGYDNNGSFHFNWGWGGLSDGYFSLDALTPFGGNYSSSQAAIFGISATGEFIRCSKSEMSFSSIINEESAVQTLSVRGHFLESNINVSVSNGFKVSTNGSNYGTSATLPPTGGTLYVIFAPTSSSQTSGEILITSGSCSANVSLNTSIIVSIPTVTTNNAFYVGTTTATYVGEVISTGGALEVARGVCWSLSHNPTLADAHTFEMSGVGVFTNSLTGLTPHTTYYFRAYATNSMGTAYGDEMSITTLEGFGAPCSINIIMQDRYGDGWNGNKIIVHNNDTIQEVTLSGGRCGTATVIINEGAVEFEWVDGNYKNECSFTITGPSCFQYIPETLPEAGSFLYEMINCNGAPTATPSFSYWTENTCNSVIVHFENNSVNAENAVWDFGDGISSSEISPTHEYTVSGNYVVTLSVNNSTCENLTAISNKVAVTVPEPIITILDTAVCISKLPMNWCGHTFTSAETFTKILQAANGCDSIVMMSLRILSHFLSDDFNDGTIDSVKWNYTGNAVLEEDGQLKLQQNVTDQDVHLRSMNLYVPASGKIAMDRRFMVHRVGRYYYGRNAILLNGNNNSYISLEYTYAEYYEGAYHHDDPRIGIYVISNLDGAETAVRLCDITFDEWLTEHVELDFTAGMLSYYLDTLVSTVSIPGLSAETVEYYNVEYRPSGWWTGHQHYLDWVDIYGELNLVSTAAVTGISSTGAACGGHVSTDGCTIFSERGVCWSTSHNPTVETMHVAAGSGSGSFTRYFTGLEPGTTYYLRAYAMNDIGTAYGNEVTFTTNSCSTYSLPYIDNFDDYTTSTRVETGVQPNCWEVIAEDVALTSTTMPQVYRGYATSGNYSLRLKNRCVYALPSLDEHYNVQDLILTFKLRQPKTIYRLQVGVVNDDGVFQVVKTINNSSTNMEDITVNFSNYTGNGHRVAFRNTLASGSNIDYSVNYIDDVILNISCGIYLLPYAENFDDCTTATTAETGAQPECWEVISEDVTLTNATKPQVYYNSAYATSGSYTLRMKNRCVYAMPVLKNNANIQELTMTFKLRQPNAIYRLQVGVVNENGEFEVVKTINNASTAMEKVKVNFSDYTGNGRRIAFRNTLANGSTLKYSINYLDDIVLDYSCDIKKLPYTEDFDNYTAVTTTETGVQPDCWEVITEDVALTEATMPQIYRGYATSGSYSLRMKNRCVFAMPEMEDNISVPDLILTFKLRQPKAIYRLQVGVVDNLGNFNLVKTINNASTDMEDVMVDFSNYTGNGHRIAFRNTLTSGSTIDYSINYLDDVVLSKKKSECSITIEMHDSYGDGWNGNKIRVHNHDTIQEVTLDSGREGTATVTVYDGSLDFEWVKGNWPNECSFTITGPCLYYSGGAPAQGVFQSTVLDCDGGTPAVSSFTYWTENTCNRVIVHFENTSTNADAATWNIGNYSTNEWNPTYEFTESGSYPVTLTTNNSVCDNSNSVINNVQITIPKPVSITKDTVVCVADLPLTWYGHTFTGTDTCAYTQQAANGCDSTMTLMVYASENGLVSMSLGSAFYAQAASNERIVMVADYNNDNHEDLITRIHPSGEIRFYRNTGNTMVYDYSLNAQPYAFSAACDENNNGQTSNTSSLVDFDNDGVTDFLVYAANHANCSSNAVRIYWGSATYPFFTNADYTELSISSPFCVGAYGTDLNNDGLTDVLIRNCGPTNLYMNEGNRVFTQTSVFNTGRDINVIFDDYNLDGNVDLCYTKNGWADSQWGMRLNIGNGDGTFNTSTIKNYANEHPLDGFLNFHSDPLEDNLPDIAFTCNNDGTNNSIVYIGEWNNSINNFQFATLRVFPSEETRIVQAFDINGDNYEDLIIRLKTGNSYSAKAYLNDGHGNFSSFIPVLRNSSYYPYKFWREAGRIMMAAYHGTARDSIVIYELTTTECGVPCPEIATLPYTEDFESHTTITTASTGVEPTCWDLVHSDVQMTAANRPQLYYKSDYAHSGKYSLLLNYRGIYAMPELSEEISVKQVKLEMYLRQPKSYYALEVGVWEDNGNFVPVTTFNNSGTGIEFVECDFSSYSGNGRRIAFRNISGDNTVRNYSYNYIDDITLTDNCEPITLPYSEDFDSYTTSATASTGVEPTCWELVQTDVQAMTDANRPQLYYNSNYAHSGSYSLLMNYRGVYAMPALAKESEIPLNRVKLSMYLRQPKAYYRLQVGVWEDNGNFVPVATFNNSGTGVTHVSCDFTSYTGSGRRIAFRNVLASGYSYNYSYNYIDDITLTDICDIAVPYAENFDEYTASTTAATGVEPECWELVREDVTMTEANRPQLYYNSNYAHSGSYSLLLNYKGVYAMPALAGTSLNQVSLSMYLRQPKAYYRLQVGVWEDNGNFVPVATFNNSGTGVTHVSCDFSNYSGNGRRIAFRNVLASGYSYNYSYNYIDNINLFRTTGKSAEVTDTNAVDALAADRDQVDVVVYPNPTKDVVNVECTMNNAQCSGIEIIDVYGKIITTVGTRFIASAESLASAYSPASSQSPVQINVSGLAAGMYFVRVTTDRGVVTKPFVKR